jgi:hypothetical protein
MYLMMPRIDLNFHGKAETANFLFKRHFARSNLKCTISPMKERALIDPVCK